MLTKQMVNLSQYRSRDTNLVSLVLPAGSDLKIAARDVAREVATAGNIKDKNVRQNVVQALKAIGKQLALHNVCPANGIALFAGAAVSCI